MMSCDMLFSMAEAMAETIEGRIASAGIIDSYYGETDEIIVVYAFNVVHSDTLEVEQFEKKAHLIPDETGKYVLDYIE